MAKSKIECNIYKRIKNGVAEYGFRVYDDKGNILIQSSNHYSNVMDAINRTRATADIIFDNPSSLKERKASDGKWYFIVVDEKREEIAYGINYFNSKTAINQEMSRIQNLFKNNSLNCGEYIKYAFGDDDELLEDSSDEEEEADENDEDENDESPNTTGSKIDCNIYKRINNGAAEYGFRVYDYNGNILIKSSKHYLDLTDAINRTRATSDIIFDSPNSFVKNRSSNGKWHFGVVDEKNEEIAVGINYFESQAKIDEEISRVRNLFKNNSLNCGEYVKYAFINDDVLLITEEGIDPLICGLRSEIYILFKQYFTEEIQDEGGSKLGARDILKLIDDFDKKYSAYNLNNRLETSISIIVSYANPSIVPKVISRGRKAKKLRVLGKKRNKNTFDSAREALLEIIEYLFNRGNCLPDEPYPEVEVEIDDLENFDIQSSFLYVQAAGSKGIDSTKGIHLRWLLKDALINHLPKGENAATTHNFNKKDDYVSIYRAPYNENSILIDFNQKPNSTNNSEAFWIYNIEGQAFYLNFLNTNKYTQVSNTINPATKPLDFIKAYGNEVIEIEHKTELSFAISPVFKSTTAGSKTKIEILSVNKNTLTDPKVVTLRKEYSTNQLKNKKLFSENIRSVRLKTTVGHLSAIRFELYYTILKKVFDEKNLLKFIDKYALEKNQNKVFERLEPKAEVVNGKWLRYNDDAYVNIQNYKDKWNGTKVEAENRISSVVDTYINLSNSANNPKADETFSLGDESDNEVTISNLDVLQFAALDFHVARMLGLGTLDLDDEILSGQYIYLATYTTLGDLQDGEGKREAQHLYCSLPTGITDERLPIAVDIKEIKPGIIRDYDSDEAPPIITNAEGYAFDGKMRFLSIINEELPDEEADQEFYYQNKEFSTAENTIPIYAGVEYKTKGAPKWEKPELAYDETYENLDNTSEALPIVIPEEPGLPLFVHRERRSGTRIYSSYGINWFSRATSSTVLKQIQSKITPSNTLLPPANLNATLIREESQLLLTSAAERNELATIANDKTFIRLTFDFNHSQDLISYHKAINDNLVNGYYELPDKDELFAKDIEVFFRNRLPVSVSGNIKNVSNHSNKNLAIVKTGTYVMHSVDEKIIPSIMGNGDNFKDGILTVGEENFKIHQINKSGENPEFVVFKNNESGIAVELDANIPNYALKAPKPGEFFLAIENMLIPDNWSLPDPEISTSLPSPPPNPLKFKVKIDHTNIHKEEVKSVLQDGNVDTHVQKFRGVYENAKITKHLEKDENNKNVHRGLYKITFTDYKLAQHSQLGPKHRVEWFNGVVRVHTKDAPVGPRKELKVFRTENIGSHKLLVIYAADLGFTENSTENAEIKLTQKVNYYPGYKLYLFHEPNHKLDEAHILPGSDEAERYSIFGLRCQNQVFKFVSPISQPVLMFAQVIAKPLTPEIESGVLYATRPDFYGKASFTFKTAFQHKPYAVQFNRASDIQILSTIYKLDSLADANDYNVESIMRDIFEDRKSATLKKRWENLLSWDYAADGGFFALLPNNAAGKRLPLPNNPKFIASINAFIHEHNSYYNESVPKLSLNKITSLHQEVIPEGANHAALQLVDFMRDIIFNSFVPLTEIPIVYKHIKGAAYQPIPKKQVIRDRDGELLKPGIDKDFDMAPMAKITKAGSQNEVQFTDFGLDGASNAKYFYATREFNLQMQMGSFSKVIGPVNLVHAAPPSSPEIVKVTPVLENVVLGIAPAIELEINSYPASENIKKVNIYRSRSAVDALSIRAMDMVEEIETTDMLQDTTWTIKDEFADLDYVPYGDPLFYKIIAQREVTFMEDGVKVIKYTPSEASKLTVTNIVENRSPKAPDLEYYSKPPNPKKELDQVTLSWNKTVHNGVYLVQKMNIRGNWETKKEHQSNENIIRLELSEINDGSNALKIEDASGSSIYHRFRIVAKNFSGMISREEKVIVIYDVNSWKNITTMPGL